jgi:NOL1/NOP2/sun family putative RNA methylase
MNVPAVPAFERYRKIIPDYEGFLEALRRPLPVTIRANTLKIGALELRGLLTERGYRLDPVPGLEEAFFLAGTDSPGSTLEYFLGYYHPQGLTSMIPARVLDPQPGENILDLCAAPGGKATHLAQLMGNRGLVVANEPKIHRRHIIRSHIDRLGTTSILATRYDGQNFPGRLQFQRMLLDPPCSAEGTYRGGPQAPLSAVHNVTSHLSRLQRALLRRAWDLLRPGGTLVYSTCTYAPEENEAVIGELLAAGQAELLPLKIPFPHSPGLVSWEGQEFHPDLAGAARFYPHHINSWGFFIAHLRKHG